jgi:hypothetical protein
VEAKKLELLGKLVPPNVTIAYLFNPNNPALEGKSNEMQEAARSLGRQLHPLNAGTEGEIDAAFATLVQQRVGEIGTITRQSMTLWVAARSADVDARHSLLQVVKRETTTFSKKDIGATIRADVIDSAIRSKRMRLSIHTVKNARTATIEPNEQSTVGPTQTQSTWRALAKR